MAEDIKQGNGTSELSEHDQLMNVFETGKGEPAKPQGSPSKPDVRVLQSERDRFAKDLEVLTQTVEQYRPVVEAFDLLQKDPEYRRAFLAEVEPDLFKVQIDVDGEVQRTLEKEFPDFQPVKEEKDIPGTKSYRYYRRADKLYQELENKKPAEVKPLKELLEARKNETKSKSEKFMKDIARIKSERNWDDNTINNMTKWIKGLSVFDYAKMFNFVMSRVSDVKNPTQLSGNRGDGTLASQVTELLGPRRSGPRQ